jgi:hypothetical protein
MRAERAGLMELRWRCLSPSARHPRGLPAAAARGQSIRVLARAPYGASRRGAKAAGQADGVHRAYRFSCDPARDKSVAPLAFSTGCLLSSHMNQTGREPERPTVAVADEVHQGKQVKEKRPTSVSSWVRVGGQAIPRTDHCNCLRTFL